MLDLINRKLAAVVRDCYLPGFLTAFGAVSFTVKCGTPFFIIESMMRPVNGFVFDLVARLSVVF